VNAAAVVELLLLLATASATRCSSDILLLLHFNCHLRHAKIMIAASMPTEECTGYYVQMLENVFLSFNEKEGRKVASVFIDIACQFGGAFNRCALVLF